MAKEVGALLPATNSIKARILNEAWPQSINDIDSHAFLSSCQLPQLQESLYHSALTLNDLDIDTSTQTKTLERIKFLEFNPPVAVN